jgi:putative lipoic acid-binding regulatory protein
MSDIEMPRIEFPCAYPIKVMGVATPHFEHEVIAMVRRHAAEVGDEHVSVRPSTNGTYLAITIVIEATGTEQLTVMFQDLKAHASVKMVL